MKVEMNFEEMGITLSSTDGDYDELKPTAVYLSMGLCVGTFVVDDLIKALEAYKLARNV